METCVRLAKFFMERSGIKDLRLAKKTAKALVNFAKMGAEIGVGGEAYKPDLETSRAILKGLNKLEAIEKGRALPQNSSKVPMPKVKPPKGRQPKKLFYTSAPGSRTEWLKLPGDERQQCCRCRHVLEDGEAMDTKEREPGILTQLCPRCGCAEYYQFKYEVTA